MNRGRANFKNQSLIFLHNIKEAPKIGNKKGSLNPQEISMQKEIPKIFKILCFSRELSINKIASAPKAAPKDSTCTNPERS